MYNKIQKKINQRFPNEKLKVLEYTNAKEYFKIQCLKCGTIYEFTQAQTAYLKAKKCLCKKCINNGTGGHYTLQGAQTRFQEHFKNEQIKVLEYTYMKSPCKIQCLSCSTIYEFNRAENVLARKKLCINCHPNKEHIIEERRKIFLEYINSEESCYYLKENVNLKHSQDKILCSCKYCGRDTKKTMKEYIRGTKCYCLSGTEKKTLAQYQKEIEDGYQVLEYNGMNNLGLFRHECGFIYKAKPIHHKCPKCKKAKSIGESVILSTLKKYEIDYIQEFGVKIEEHNLRFDFYLPSKNMMIEFQGIQHFWSIKYFGGEQRFQKQQYYDFLKKQYCEQNNIFLLEITYLDLQNNDIEHILLNNF